MASSTRAVPRSGCLAISSIGTPMWARDLSSTGQVRMASPERVRYRARVQMRMILANSDGWTWNGPRRNPALRAVRGVAEVREGHDGQQQQVDGVQVAGVTLEQRLVVRQGQRQQGRAAEEEADRFLADEVQRLRVGVAGALDGEQPAQTQQQDGPQHRPINLSDTRLLDDHAHFIIPHPPPHLRRSPARRLDLPPQEKHCLKRSRRACEERRQSRLHHLESA